MVGVTGQVQQVASSVVQRVRQRDGQGHKPGIRTGMVRSEPGSEQEKSAAVQKQDAGQKQDTGPRTNTTPRQSLWVWPSLKYPSIISSRC
ncbi:unnamed protein product [Staurois parvus]|uniref:Uncharacterized protein n=1 Tax=Staurois parvus TaxID=386267 RepID=A0ABN9FYU8_9NEOB|nr:unnamed protein product [Staurois parvus]